MSPLTGNIYAGTISKRNPNEWQSKCDVTHDFYGLLVREFSGEHYVTEKDTGKRYKISVVEVTEESV